MRSPILALLLTLAAVPLAAQEPAGVVPGGTSHALRPGDIVKIDVWGHPEFSGQFGVDETGQIQYPVLGQIDVRNMTVGDLRDRMRAGLEQLFNSPFVTVTPLFRMAVLGRVQKPGLYTVDPTLSIVDVVALAGGASEGGNLGKIKLLRSGEASRIDYEQTSLQGRTLQEIGVRSGDQIVIPKRFLTRDDISIILGVVQVALSTVILINTLK